MRRAIALSRIETMIAMGATNLAERALRQQMRRPFSWSFSRPD